MNKKRTLVSLGASFCLLVGCTTTSTQWEYQSKMNASSATMNALGKEGWELVSVTPKRMTSTDRTNATTVEQQEYFFKRPHVAKRSE